MRVSANCAWLSADCGMPKERLVVHLPDGSTGWLVLWGSVQDVWADIRDGNCDEWLEVAGDSQQQSFVRRDAIIRVELHVDTEPRTEVEEFVRERLAVRRPGDPERA